MSRFFPVLMLVLVLTGAILGWNAVPHYRAPADNGEARLRVRAAEYYQATRVFDSLKMAQLYTPAKQLVEHEDLLADSKENQAVFESLPDANKANLYVSAESITPESLELELNGDWATTWGECIYPTENSQVPVQLDKMVWVKSGGDWWIYTWTKPEISAYGNPPDESYELLKKRRLEISQKLAREMQQAELQAGQQKAPVEAGDVAGTTDSDPQGEPESELEDGE